MKIKEVGLVYRDTGVSYPKNTLSTPKDIVRYMAHAFDERPDQESFWVILLNVKNKPLGRHIVSLGTVGAALVHACEIFRAAILEAATSIFIVHNHPSPSRADRIMTKK